MTLRVDQDRKRALLNELRAQVTASQNKSRKNVREFSEEAVVRVWRDQDALTTGHFGHAAMTIRGPRFAADSGKGIYISWWPADGAGVADGVASFFGRTMGGVAGDSYRDDKYDEMADTTKDHLAHGDYAPRAGQSLVPLPQGYGSAHAVRINGTRFVYAQSVDAKIRLPGTAADRVHFGLDLQRMADWWTAFLDADPHYQLASRTHSCAGVVRQALKAGGAKAYTEAPPSTGYATPSEMEDWAEHLRLRLDGLNRDANTFLTRLAPTSGRVFVIGQRGVGRTAVPTVEQWRRMSTRPRGGRGSNVSRIDAHLRDYHRPVMDHKDVARRLGARVAIFEIILRAVLRQRNEHDEDVLKTLGRAILTTTP